MEVGIEMMSGDQSERPGVQPEISPPGEEIREAVPPPTAHLCLLQSLLGRNGIALLKHINLLSHRLLQLFH